MSASSPLNCLRVNEVDHAADRVRAVGRRSAVLQDLDAVERDARKRVEIDECCAGRRRQRVDASRARPSMIVSVELTVRPRSAGAAPPLPKPFEKAVGTEPALSAEIERPRRRRW